MSGNRHRAQAAAAKLGSTHNMNTLPTATGSTWTMASSPTQRDVLLQQIARERREVCVLESERVLLLSRFNHRQSQGADAMIDTANTNARNSSKKRPRPHYHGEDISEDQMARVAHDGVGQDGDRDLLDVLDALQCRTTLETMNENNVGEAPSSTSSTSLVPSNAATGGWGSLREVDADSYWMHPILGGITFTGVKGPLPPGEERSQKEEDINTGKSKNSKRRLYILSGHTNANLSNVSTSAGSECKSECCCIGFEVRAEICFADRSDGSDDERATVSSVHTKFFPHPSNGLAQDDDSKFALPFPKEELEELAELISKTQNLTRLFRELVAFHEFHMERSASMERLVKEFGTDGCLSITCADMMEIRSSDGNMKADGDCLTGDKRAGTGVGPLLCLRLSWSRSFSELGREDDLCVEECTVGGNGEADNAVDALVDTILDPDGIDSLVHIAGGIEEAIRAIIRAVTGT